METIKDLKGLLGTAFAGKTGQVDINYNIGGDLDFAIDGKIIAWIPCRYFDEEFYLETEIIKSIHTSNSVFKNLHNLVLIGDWLCFKMVDINVVVSEKEVTKEVESPEQHKLSGKVEAYENILLGREVNIGR